MVLAIYHVAVRSEANRCIDENIASRLLAGALSPDERSEVERHLDACPSCSQVLAEVARVFHAGASAPVTAALVPAGALPTLQSQEPELGVGAEVGRYHIERRLAAGGMGIVFVAFDPALGRRVALKVLRAELLQDERSEEAMARLTREAQAMARLSVPNVVPVYDVGTWAGRPFLAMELVDGVTLRDWLRQSRRFEEIAGVFRQAAEGLAAAHAAGLVHRDFKPENVLVTRDGRAKVSDFGLTRAEWGPALRDPYRRDAAPGLAAGPEPLTMAGAVLGTPAYMAPEQLFGRGADVRSDVFSFAASYYEALYGTRPYPARSLDELRWRLASGRIEPPARSSDAPIWVLKVLQRALATDPARRPQTIRELLDALDAESRKRPGLYVTVNVVVQGILLFAHIWLCGIFVAALASSGSPTAEVVPTTSGSDFQGPIWTAVAGVMVLVLFSMVVWAPLGLVWVPVNMYGLLKRRPWARVSSMLYAALSFTTCFGTAYAFYGLWSLSRAHVKALFRD